MNVRNVDGETPLHCAAEIGCIEIARLLIEHGARVDAKCIDWTPLHVSIFGRRRDVARLLIENGADVTIADMRGATPRQLADPHPAIG